MDYTVPAIPVYPTNTVKPLNEKKSLRQEQAFGDGIRLKWHVQLNVLVDIMLQLTSSLKINGSPPLEATPDELRLFYITFICISSSLQQEHQTYCFTFNQDVKWKY
jgi:hypothetical protein